MSRGDAGRGAGPAEPAPTGVTVAGHFSPMMWSLLFTRLTVEIDGERHRGRWRRRFLPTSPGRHQVEVSFAYVGNPRCGAASLVVEVAEGTTVALAYKAPNLPTSPGRLEARPST